MIHILPRIEYSIDSSKSPEEINTIMNSVTVPREMMYRDSDDALWLCCNVCSCTGCCKDWILFSGKIYDEEIGRTA